MRFLFLELGKFRWVIQRGFILQFECISSRTQILIIYVIICARIRMDYDENGNN